MCPASPQGQTYPRVFQAQHHQEVKSDGYPALLSIGAALSGVSCAVSGPHSLRRMWKYSVTSREWQQKWYKGWKKYPVRGSRKLCICLFWRKEGWGKEGNETSLLLTAFQGGEVKELLISSPFYLGIGHVGMIQNSTREGLDWILGNISLLKGCSNTGTSFLQRRLMCQVCQCLRGFQARPLIVYFNIWAALVRARLVQLGWVVNCYIYSLTPNRVGQKLES